MPWATTQSPNLQHLGPIIPVVILPSSAFVKALKENDPDAVKKYETGFQAMMLIDTGASCTAIDKEISRVLDLKHRGVTHISTPSSNSHECLTYDIDLIIPGNQSHIQNIEVIETELMNQGINGLLGRDVLKNILFLYHGNTGQFTLAI